MSAALASSIFNFESGGFADYLSAEAALRARLMHNNITAIGIAFKAGLIDADNALEHLADCGALWLATPSSV